VPTREDAEAAGSLVVAASEASLRLDAFLTRRRLLPSAAAARRAVAAGVVRVNGRVATKGRHLAPGDTVAVGGAPTAALLLEPAPELPLEVLYQDSDVVAVSKPAAVPTHPLRPGEGDTLAGALVARFPECATASPDAREGGLGHRLDTATSGVLLAARRREVWYRLRQALSHPQCEKVYLAETGGVFPAPDADLPELVLPGPAPASFVISVAIGRQGRRAGRVKLGAGRNPLPARTQVSLLAARAAAALVEARLHRGRAHQVRAHLAYLGIPVLGDAIYGEPGSASGLHLHAFSVALLHPSTGQPLVVTAPPPVWVRAYSNWAMLVSTRR
jgi:23S rRNA pseudouridine1911/1915/1917 synthase